MGNQVGSWWQRAGNPVRRAASAALAVLAALAASHASAFDLQFNTVTDTDPVPTRGVLAYTVTVENSGFSTATDVRTVFAVPDGASVEGGPLALPSASNASCALNGGFVVCTHGDMVGTGAGGGTPPITFTLRFRAPATLPAPPNVGLRGAIGRGAPPLGTAQAAPQPLFAPGSAFWTGDTNENNNANPVPLQQTSLENNADLAITAGASSDPIPSGARLTYTLTATNVSPNSNATTGARVRVTLPAGATYVGGSASGAGWSFSGPTAGVLTATRGAGSLAVGANAPFTLQTDVTIASGTLTLNAEIDTDRAEPGALLDNQPANNTTSLATTVAASADLQLTKTLNGATGPFTAGSTIPYRLSPRNLGQSAAADVVVRDVLPSGHTLQPAFPLPPATQAFGAYTCRTNNADEDDLGAADPGRAARSILRCERTSLPVGATDNIDFSVVTSTALSGNITNTATLSASTPDPVPGNNSGSVAYTVLPDGADVQLVSYAKTPALVSSSGGTIAHSIRVRNNGARAVDANLQVFVTLAAGETFGSAGGGWSCAAEVGGVRCTYTGTYPVASGATSGGGGFADLTLNTTAGAVGTLTSNACVGGSGGSEEPTVTGFTVGSTTDFITGNDCSGSRSVRATDQRADLSLTKLTSTPAGGDKVVEVSETEMSYTLTVTNSGPDATGGVVLDDAIPGFISGQTTVSVCGFTGAGSCVPPAGNNLPATVNGWSCTLNSGTVTCRSNAVLLDVGAANAATFVVRVGRPVRDSLNQSAVGGCSAAGQFCNSAGVAIDVSEASAALETSTGDNQARDVVTVHALANLQTTDKSFTPALAQVGVDVTYTVNYRNPASSGSDLPAVASPPAGQPAGVIFTDTFNLAANDPGFVLRSATIVSGAACSVTGTTGGVVSAPGAGGTSYSTGASAGTVTIECPRVTMARNQDRQVRIVVRPNLGATGPLLNDAGFRIVDSTDTTVAASGATFDYNRIANAADDQRSATVNFAAGQIDLRIENTDLQDPIGWDPAAASTSPGVNDIVYRVQVRNAGPSVATQARFDYTVTPPTGATLRFIGDEEGTSVTPSSGAAAANRCVVHAGANPVAHPATLTLRCTSPGFGFTPNVDGAIAAGTGPADGAFLNLRFRFETAPAPLGATVNTNAVVTGAETETDNSNNAEAEITTVRTRADLAISKTGFTAAVPALPAALPAAVGTVGLRQPFNWVVELVNNGPGDSLSRDRSGTSPLNGTGTVITDTLPAGVTVTGPVTWEKQGSSSFPGAVTTGTGTCTQAGLVLTCNVGDVANGGRVRVTLPVRWDTWPGGAGNLSPSQTNSASAASEQFDPTGGNNSVTHAVQVTRSSLAGMVFEDRDRAGANSGTPQSAGADPRIAGVQVLLRTPSGNDAWGNAFTPQTQTTAADGLWSFTNLPAGDYEIVAMQPAGLGNSPGNPTTAAPADAPSLATTYTAVGATPPPAPLPPGANSRYTVTLGVQQDGVRFNFPEAALFSLSGFVYVDRNLNNVRDVGTDTAVTGTQVRLRNAATPGAPPLATTSTAVDGSYSFASLDPGITYVLEQPLPAGLQNRPSAVNVGTVGGVVTGTAAPDTPSSGTDRITGITLSADGVQYNFGEDLPPDPPQPAPISGRVFLDRDRNGQPGVQEPGIAGVSVGLYTAGQSCPASGPLPAGALQQVQTSSSGDFSFSPQPVGSGYVICQAQPAGYGDRPPVPGIGGASSSANQIEIGVLGGGGSANHLFPEVLASISGQVWVDHGSAVPAQHDNGLREAGERGLGAGVPVTLSGTPSVGPNADQPVMRETQTDADGQYRFDDLFPGRWTVSQREIPASLGTWADGRNRAGPISAGIAGTAGAVGDNHIRYIQPQPGAISTDNNFGKLPAPATPPGVVAPGTASISGLVYLDRNRDGQMTAADPGRLAGVMVRLVEGETCGGTELAQAFTDEQGRFRFSAADLTPPATLVAGRAYSLCQVQPQTYGDGAVNPGPSGTAAAANHISIRALPAGESADHRFGEVPGWIGGRVFLDRQDNGSYEPGDPATQDSGLPGVSVTLTGGNLPQEGRSVLSAADGSFRFDDLPAGTYQLTQQAAQPVAGAAQGVTPEQTTLNGQTRAGPAGGSASTVSQRPSSVVAIPLPPGGQAPDHLFAEVLPVRISGRVWLDANGNGVPEPAETGIGGVTIELSGSDRDGQPVALATVTDADGQFRFDALRPGQYTLTQPQQPPGTLPGVTLPGPVGGGSGTPVAVAPSRISGLSLPTAGMVSPQHLFGEVPPARISGAVYLDRNADGQRQDGEPGFAQQRLELTGTDDLGQPVALQTRSEADGAFAFTDLRPGRYTVTQPAQPADTDNGITTPGVGGGQATPVETVPSRIRDITLGTGQSAPGQLFGETQDGADLVISKRASPAVFTEGHAGLYVIALRNRGSAASSGEIVVVDTLPTGMTLAPATATQPNPLAPGFTCSTRTDAGQQTVECRGTPVLAPGQVLASAIQLRVEVATGLCTQYPCERDNRVQTAGGGERRPPAVPTGEWPRCSAQAPEAGHDACRLPTPVQQSGGVAGKVWLDLDQDRRHTAGTDVLQRGFVVELLQAGVPLRTAVTDERGEYRFLGLVPGSDYEIRFRDASSGVYWGRAVSADPAGGNDPRAQGPAGVVPDGALSGFSVPGGNAVRLEQNLPLDPSGVVYDSATRLPVGGAVVELLGPGGTLVPAACVLGGVNRITTAPPGATDGSVPGGYAFWLLTPPAPGCPGDGTYRLRVTPPAGYLNAGVPSDGSPTATSLVLPARPGSVSVPGSCQNYAPGRACAIQAQHTAPQGSQPTPYYWTVPLTPATPAGFVDIVHNHIPLDPVSGARFVLAKQASRSSAEVGDAVSYTLTLRHVQGPALPQVQVRDWLPAGFRYVPGSLRINGVAQRDPDGSPGPNLNFAAGPLPAAGQISLSYVLRVGVGAQQGDGLNRAQASAVLGTLTLQSNEATARVRVTGGVFGEQACVIGKVYVDCNHNQRQDAEELGIPGVRLYLQDGTSLTTDVEGKYSFCGLPPRTHVLKADLLTLPRGSRLVTSSSRNAGDANSLFLDPRNGELQRADFIEGSCSNTVLEQVRARRTQGEVRAPENERRGGAALKFEGRAPQYPQQGTTSANQPLVRPRDAAVPPSSPARPAVHEQNLPVPLLPAASSNTQRQGAGAAAAGAASAATGQAGR